MRRAKQNILTQKGAPAKNSPVDGDPSSSDATNSAAAKPAAPPLPTPTSTASCTFERAPTAQGPQNVGERMTLTCQGDFGATVEKNAQVRAPEGQEYGLQILNVLESNDHLFKAAATSYRVGQHQNEVFIISDGKTVFATSPLNFTVQTVIEQKQGEEPKPFASYGPFDLRYPMWFWASLLAAILVIALAIFFGVRRRQKRKKLLEELEKFTTMLPAFGQFSKDARLNTRKLGSIRNETDAAALIKKIDEDFRLYLIRELKVPALQVSNKEVLREIKRSHPGLFVEFQGDLRRILFEFEKATKDVSKVKASDCEELLFLSRKVADSIYSVKKRPK